MSTDILNAMQNGHMKRTGHELVAHLEPAPTEFEPERQMIIKECC